MTLRLTILNVASLPSGDPVEMVLNEHGLIIGRAAHADWTLPDPRNHISSVHCEIDYQNGAYTLSDRSTNGTFINGTGTRMTAPHRLRDGDLLTIGQYELRVSFSGDGNANGQSVSANSSGGLDWTQGHSPASKPADPNIFGREPIRPLIHAADDPLMNQFTPPSVAPSTVNDPFGIAPSGTSSAPVPSANFPPHTPPVGNDPFGVSHSPAPAPAPPHAQPNDDNPWAKVNSFGAIDFTTASQVPIPAPAPTPATPPEAVRPEAGAIPGPPQNDGLFDRFLSAAGLKRRDIGDAAPADVMEAAGQLIRQTADGLIRLLDARARVRHQFGVGAQVTTFQRAGNNPLKWTRSPEQALRQLIGEPEAGFLTGPLAVRGAFEDLQAHELAMIAAMQEALKATVERFAPAHLRARAKDKGFLARVLPGARDAALWQAYEAEFSALASESEAAYLDLFAKNFRLAYARNIERADRQ